MRETLCVESVSGAVDDIIVVTSHSNKRSSHSGEMQLSLRSLCVVAVADEVHVRGNYKITH